MHANFLSSNLRHILPRTGTESPSLSSVMARVETEGSGVGGRKLSVAETLKQATEALETHRAWMKRRVSTSIAPLDCGAENGRESAIVVGEEIYPKTSTNVGWALGSEKGIKQRGDNRVEGAGPPTSSARGVAQRVPAPPLSTRAWQQGHESESASNNSPLTPAGHGLLESPNTPFPEYDQDSPDTVVGAMASNKLHFTFPSSTSSQTKQSNFKIKKRQRMGKSSVVPMTETLTEVDKELSKDILLSPNRAKSPEVFIGESFQSKISPIAPASTLVAWGSLSSLDNYIESLEGTNKNTNQKSTQPESAKQTTFTPFGSLANGTKEENHDTVSTSPGSKAISSPQQPLVRPDLVQSSTIHHTGSVLTQSKPSSTRAEDSFADCSDIPSPSKDESGESSFESSLNAEHFEALKAASNATLIPVSQAPRAQRSSFSLHKQSKLEAAEANMKIYKPHFKERSNLQTDDGVSRYHGDRLGQLSFRNSSSVNIPDSILETVLPKHGERARKSGLAMLHTTKDSTEHATTLQVQDQQSTPDEEEKDQQPSLQADSQPPVSQTSLKASLQTSVAPLEEEKKQFRGNKTGSLLVRSKSFPTKEAGGSSLKDGDTSLKGDELQIEEVTSSDETGGLLFPSHSTPRFKSHALEVLKLPPLKTMAGKISIELRILMGLFIITTYMYLALFVYRRSFEDPVSPHSSPQRFVHVPHIAPQIPYTLNHSITYLHVHSLFITVS